MIKGLIQVKVHKSQFVVSTGGRFLVPRGNTYSIVNISNKESTLFFVQTKQPRPDTRETIATSSAAASTSSSAARNTKASGKRNSQIGGYTIQPGADLSDQNPSPSPVEEATTAAVELRSPSPVPVANKRRSTSVRRSPTKKTETAVTPPSPSLLPSTSAEETAKSNGGATAGVSRQPSVLASMFR